MPSYTFRLEGPDGALEDSAGTNLANDEAVWCYACGVAHELMRCELLSGYRRLDVYDHNQTLIFQIPLLTPTSSKTELSRERRCEHQPVSKDLPESARVTMRESCALIARAHDKPYTAMDFGEQTIRPVSIPASNRVVGLVVGSCFSNRGHMVPAETIRTDTTPSAILFVEDEPLIRLSVAEFLRKAEFIVIEAGTAHEALTVLKVRSDVALVLTDLNMPGALDSAGLIRQIRKSYPAVKVVVASAFKTAEPVEATVAKPYSLERVLEVIQSVLAG